MVLTPAEIDALSTYTGAQMVKLWRHVLVQIGSEGPEAQVQGPNGRGYSLRNLDEVRRMVEFWEQREASEAAATSGSGTFDLAEL